MKKLAFFTTLLMLILVMAGCSKKEKFLVAEDVTENTILAKANGIIQVATIEPFDKSYYDMNGLTDFVNKEIDKYSKKAGKDKIIVDKIIKKDSNAVMVLTYSGMDQYATFNNVTAAYFNGGVSDMPLDLPATLINVKNESLASTQEIIQNNSYKILVINEPYNIIVDGKVKYYSENAKLIKSNEVKGAPEGMTIIVFK